MELRICHLYPDLLNLYGDRGNIMTLVNRARWREIDVQVDERGLGDRIDVGGHDLYFIGGGEDRQQRLAAEDLRATKGETLQRATDAGAVALAVCGGYQLLGHSYRPAEGPELVGLGLLDLQTVHPGKRARRLVGNIVIRSSQFGETTLVGFENHGGRTHLGPRSRPLGQVIVGFGNNGEDHTEGAVCGTVYGTYLHGPLLPKNAVFADYLIAQALRRRFGEIHLRALPDTAETIAHAAAAARAGAR